MHHNNLSGTSPGDVAREAKSALSPKRQAGKGLCEPCVICGENRWTEVAHFPSRKHHGGVETIQLCPTHHKLLDRGRLSDWEFMEICRKKYSNLQVLSAKKFIEWAHLHGYAYSSANIAAKAIRAEYKNAQKITYRIENES